MATMTITEGLAELKTIAARIGKNRQAILMYAFRDSKMVDPLANDGGSEKFIREKLQALRDLSNRFVAIRRAIQAKNLETDLTLHEQTRSVQEWLTWRHEVAKGEKDFANGLVTTLASLRQALVRAADRTAVGRETPSTEKVQIIAHISEKSLSDDIEGIEQLLGDLDGKLSLHNATAVIDIED